MLLEAARLCGALPLVEIPASVALVDAIKVLTPKFAVHLVAELISRKGCSEDEFRTLNRAYDDLPRLIAQRIAEVAPQFESRLNFKSFPRLEVATFGRSVSTLESGFRLEMPAMKVVVGKLSVETPSQFDIAPLEVRCLRDVTAVAGSDVMFADGAAVVDMLSFLGAESGLPKPIPCARSFETPRL